MKRILLPTDFSKNARNAIKYAVDVFGKDAQFYLVNVFREPHATSSSLVSIVDILQKTSEDSLVREQKKMEALFPSLDLNIEAMSIYGDTATVINDLSNEHKVDYVVMGTKGASGIKEVLLGSVTADVIQKVSRPLIAVPDRCSFTGFEKLGFAADLREIQDHSCLEPMIEMAKHFSSAIEIVTIQNEVIYASEEEALVGLEIHDILRGVDHKFVRRESEDVIEGIEDYMHEENPDLMVLIPRRTKFWDRVFRISVTKKIALHADVPLLILRDKISS